MSNPGYPDYKEIMDMRERRRRQEMEGGRQRTLRAMAEGLIERWKGDYKIKGEVIPHTDDNDPRKWTVTIKIQSPEMEFNESIWAFPSEELQATLMLITT